MNEIIELVKQGKPLGKERLQKAVNGYLSGVFSKAEMTAFLRAVCDYGMSDEDAAIMTEVMLSSGETLCFKPREFPYADKHSTGGVADSTTLIIAPIVASCGVPFLKMSGRKLGHTGGTIDKLECFEGLRTEISVEEAERIVDNVGAAIIAQSKELVPADKALYKLRDETDTVKSLPLIASSVVSKKLASGAEVLVLDVKTGAGAFMETVEEGEELARLMVRILKSAGRKAAAVISDMNSPLGEGVGGVMEVIDAIEVLEGKGGRLKDLAVFIAGSLVSLAKGLSEKEGAAQAEQALSCGAALNKLKQIVAAQGGSLDLFNKETRAAILKKQTGAAAAEEDGYVQSINLVKLGLIARAFEEEGGLGMTVPVKVGDFVKRGEPLSLLYGKPSPQTVAALKGCFRIVKDAVKPNPLIYRVVV